MARSVCKCRQIRSASNDKDILVRLNRDIARLLAPARTLESATLTFTRATYRPPRCGVRFDMHLAFLRRDNSLSTQATRDICSSQCPLPLRSCRSALRETPLLRPMHPYGIEAEVSTVDAEARFIRSITPRLSFRLRALRLPRPRTWTRHIPSSRSRPPRLASGPARALTPMPPAQTTEPCPRTAARSSSSWLSLDQARGRMHAVA